jgi:hypothetical protein
MRVLHSGLTLSVALALSGCGDGLSNGTPSSPTSGASPTPTAAATATPTPAPTVNPSVKSCSLPPQPNCAADNGPYEYGCCTEKNIENPDPAFLSAISEAQGYVAATRPELFSGSKVKSGSERAYTLAVAKRVTEFNGICAASPSYIPEDEITLKSRQDRGENYDILQGDGTTWIKYTSLCLPALF